MRAMVKEMSASSGSASVFDRYGRSGLAAGAPVLEMTLVFENFQNDFARAVQRAMVVEVHPGPCASGINAELELRVTAERIARERAEAKLRKTNVGELETERDRLRREVENKDAEISRLKARVEELRRQLPPDTSAIIGIATEDSRPKGESIAVRLASGVDAYFKVNRPVFDGAKLVVRDFSGVGIEAPAKKATPESTESVWRRARVLLGPLARKLPETLAYGSVMKQIVDAVIEICWTEVQAADVDVMPIEEPKSSADDAKVSINGAFFLQCPLTMDDPKPKPADEVASRFGGLDIEVDDDQE